MRNVTTYRICAGAGGALVLLGVARGEVWTVLVGGILAVYCLRWALIERLAEQTVPVEWPVGCSHVRLLRDGEDPVTPTR